MQLISLTYSEISSEAFNTLPVDSSLAQDWVRFSLVKCIDIVKAEPTGFSPTQSASKPSSQMTTVKRRISRGMRYVSFFMTIIANGSLPSSLRKFVQYPLFSSLFAVYPLVVSVVPVMSSLFEALVENDFALRAYVPTISCLSSFSSK